jgi:GNAT superfamily N-acetyltransferase
MSKKMDIDLEEYKALIDEIGVNDIQLDISVVQTIDIDEWIKSSTDIYGPLYGVEVAKGLHSLDLNNRGFDFILVKHNDKIIGRAIIIPDVSDSHTVNLLGFIIDYEYRGIGIGTVLMEFIKIKYKHLILVFTTTSDIMEFLGIKTGFSILCNGVDTIINQPCKWMILKR